MVKFAFQQGNYEKWLADFASQLETRLEGNVFTLPAHLGKGKILAYDLNANLSCLIMNCKLEKDLEFQRQPGGKHGFSLAFNQVEPGNDQKGSRSDIYLSDAQDELHTRLPAGSTVKRVIIFYSTEIAAQYLTPTLLEQLGSFARQNSVSENKFMISLPHRETLKDIFGMTENDPLGKVRRLSYIIQLSEKFLHSFVRQEQTTIPRTLKKNDLESMQHVEHILSSRLEGFPSLEYLAHEVFMSTSKLKNLFKQVYGYTLYDYYNKSRLQRAKEMLVTGQCSIKQAGSEIGFSNLSHFAKAFKREFGALPRDILRNR
ncbi:MAG TPA: helix-turn-helix transcriptional regulator [Puia sp.]|nr:helix-turn-helix transcriptional regulator [Puia sp.]